MRNNRYGFFREDQWSTKLFAITHCRSSLPVRPPRYVPLPPTTTRNTDALPLSARPHQETAPTFPEYSLSTGLLTRCYAHSSRFPAARTDSVINKKQILGLSASAQPCSTMNTQVLQKSWQVAWMNRQHWLSNVDARILWGKRLA